MSALLALVLTPGLLAACHRDDSQQLAVVQGLARDLSSAKLLKARVACRNLVAEQNAVLLCDGLVQTLLQYAPGFPGSTVTALDHSSGGWRGHPTSLPVHYQGPGGTGNLDVLLRHESIGWKIFALVPRK